MHADRFNAARVCKRWQNLVSDSRMWLHVDSDHDARMNVFSSLQDAVLAARYTLLDYLFWADDVVFVVCCVVSLSGILHGPRNVNLCKVLENWIETVLFMVICVRPYVCLYSGVMKYFYFLTLESWQCRKICLLPINACFLTKCNGLHRMSTGVSLWYSKLSMTKALIGAFEDGFNTFGGCCRTPSCLVLASLIW